MYPVEKMCVLLSVSRSGFYDCHTRKESNRSKDDKVVLKEIIRIHDESKQTYGSPRITSELHDKGYRISEVKVARMMQKNHISAITKKRFKQTTDSKHNFTISPNLLKRQFNVYMPSKAWVSDMTYIATQQGWVYLTTVIDLFDRKVIGRSISDNMECRNTVVPALNMALANRSTNSDTIFHSDRGVQYACKEFRNLIDKAKLKQSMSRKGDCWDNAVAESFFSTLKKESVRKTVFYSRQAAKTEITYYIEAWYNLRRKHSTLGYLSPVQFENKYRLANVA